MPLHIKYGKRKRDDKEHEKFKVSKHEVVELPTIEPKSYVPKMHKYAGKAEKRKGDRDDSIRRVEPRKPGGVRSGTHTNSGIALRPKGEGDWSVPGTNYMGAGNKLDDYEATTPNDKLSKEHDQIENYDYFNWVTGKDGDQEFLDKVDDKDLSGWIAKKFFSAKQLAFKKGFIKEVAGKKISKMPKFDDNHRRPTPVDDVDMDSSPVMETSAARSSGQVTGRTDGSETGISPWMHPRLKPFYPTQNVIMPYISFQDVTLATGTGAGSYSSICIRLNSIVDCLTDATFVANAAPAADGVDATLNSPMYFTYWSKYYRYYSVLSSKYKISIVLNDQTSRCEIACWLYHNGQQQPPIINAGTTTVVPDYIRKTHEHCHVTYLRDREDKAGGYYDRGVEIDGSYVPGSVDHEVMEDEYKQTWHTIAQTPPQREVATLILQRSDWARAVETASTHSLKIKIEVVYHVQWKDLVSDQQYPTLTSDVEVSTDPAGVTN